MYRDWIFDHQMLIFFKALCSIRAGLRYGDYRSKLVHFKAQKIFCFKKQKALALSDF
jgi:hypothetical protein